MDKRRQLPLPDGIAPSRRAPPVSFIVLICKNICNKVLDSCTNIQKMYLSF